MRKEVQCADKKKIDPCDKKIKSSAHKWTKFAQVFFALNYSTLKWWNYGFFRQKLMPLFRTQCTTNNEAHTHSEAWSELKNTEVATTRAKKKRASQRLQFSFLLLFMHGCSIYCYQSTQHNCFYVKSEKHWWKKNVRRTKKEEIWVHKN